MAVWRTIWVAAVLLCSAAPPSLPAQDQRQDQAATIAVAILARLRADLPAGAASLDPEMLCSPRLVGWRCPERLRAAAAAQRFSLRGHAFTLICLGGSNECRLVNVQSLVVLESISVSAAATRAQVEATIWEGGASGVAVSRRVRISLRRDADAGWSIVSYAR